MRAVVQQAFGGPEVLHVRDVADPVPGPGEVRIRMGGAGVNPVDVAVRAGSYPLLGEPPFTVGWDVAGVVDALGPGVSGRAVGDRVFGLARFPGEAAAYAELVVAPASELARTPEALSDVESAALPLAGLTAYQALVETAGVTAGQRVLVQAAGGGVGHLAVQVAKARGADVVAVVSPGKVGLVRALGADEVVDYTAGPFLDRVGPVDVALDPFGSPNTQSVVSAVRRGGTVVSLLDVDDDARRTAAARDVRLERILVHPSGPQLEALARLAERGVLRPHVAATYPLDKAGEAHRALDTGATGKVVLTP